MRDFFKRLDIIETITHQGAKEHGRGTLRGYITQRPSPESIQRCGPNATEVDAFVAVIQNIMEYSHLNLREVRCTLDATSGKYTPALLQAVDKLRNRSGKKK